MNIAVVTSVWGNYAKYLPEWAESIAAQSLLPVEVAIVDAGCEDRSGIGEAASILRTEGLEPKLGTVEYTTIGAARNAATALSATEWVMHLDADDTLTPTCLEDVSQYQDDADVVSFGCIRGEATSIITNASASRVLNGGFCAYSCAAFRRSFWERRPWQTRNDWCDSTFWVGLAHLGARFATTGKIGFIYRQHDDSVSHTLSPEDKQFAIDQWLEACKRWHF